MTFIIGVLVSGVHPKTRHLFFLSLFLSLVFFHFLLFLLFGPLLFCAKFTCVLSYNNYLFISLLLSFVCCVRRTMCRHTIRLLLDKWGIDNVNDLIVDETVDDFESTRRFNDIPLFDQKPPDPNQTPTFNDLPNAVPTDGFHHLDGGYNYPNPNKVNTAAPPASQPQPQPSYLPPPPPSPSVPSSSPAATPGGYLPTNGYTVNHNPGADRYWSGFSYSINQRWANSVFVSIFFLSRKFTPRTFRFCRIFFRSSLSCFLIFRSLFFIVGFLFFFLAGTIYARRTTRSFEPFACRAFLSIFQNIYEYKKELND